MMAMPMATAQPWGMEKSLHASTAWPKEWPRFSLRRSPVSNSSSITARRFRVTQVEITCSTWSLTGVFQSSSKKLASKSTLYLMISPQPQRYSRSGRVVRVSGSHSTSQG